MRTEEDSEPLALDDADRSHLVALAHRVYNLGDDIRQLQVGSERRDHALEKIIETQKQQGEKLAEILSSTKQFSPEQQKSLTEMADRKVWNRGFFDRAKIGAGYAAAIVATIATLLTTGMLQAFGHFLKGVLP